VIDLSDDSKVEIVDTLLMRKDSYFAFDEAIGGEKDDSRSYDQVIAWIPE
jgi:hypothetical protein